MHIKIKNTYQSAWGQATIGALSIVIILLFLSWLFPKFDSDWLEAEKQISEHWQFSDLFYRMHSHPDAPILDGRQVYVMNISEYQSREDLTNLFDSLAAAKPYCVALDVIFGNSIQYDSIVNKRLVESIQRLPNLILATEGRYGHGETRYVRSFFAESIHAQEAITNLPSPIVRNWTPKLIVQSDTLTTFATAIAKKIYDDVPQEGEFLIDYSIQESLILQPQQPSFCMDFVRDQVVIVGDIEDLRDSHNVPMTFRTSTKLSGVLVHKQIVQTIMAHSLIRKASSFLTWLFVFIVLWLFIFIDKKISSSNQLLQQVLKMVVILAMIGNIYCLFWYAQIYVNAWNIVLAPAILWIGDFLKNIFKIFIALFQKSKKRLVSICFFIVMALPAFSQYYISSVNGNVQIMRNGKWQDAYVTMELQETDLVQTQNTGCLTVIDRANSKLYTFQSPQAISLNKLIANSQSKTKNFVYEYVEGVFNKLFGRVDEQQNTAVGVTYRDKTEEREIARAISHTQKSDYLVSFLLLDYQTLLPLESVQESQIFIVQLNNMSDTPLYMNIIDTDSNGTQTALFPPDEKQTMLHLYIPPFSTVRMNQFPIYLTPAGTTDKLTLVASPMAFDIETVITMMNTDEGKMSSSDLQAVGQYTTQVMIK